MSLKTAAASTSSLIGQRTSSRASSSAKAASFGRRFASSAPNRAYIESHPQSRRYVLAVAAVAATGLYVYQQDSSNPIRNDAKDVKRKSPTSDLHTGHEHLGVHLWGTNRYRVVAPDASATSSSASQVKRPRYLNALSGQSFRDLALYDTYAVAVTPKGDLLQWGAGYAPSTNSPTPTLRGQDVCQVALTPNKIYARTKSGQVLIIPVSQADQTDTSNGKQLPTISFFWKLLGYHNPGVHFVKMELANQQAKNKKIMDISAGRSHLLAVSGDGKALCAAVDEQCNECGQLGGGKLLMEGISSRASGRTVVDKEIEYDTRLKEIPGLRNLSMTQLVAGDRHSLALTTEGRVLAWGNNNLGQLGLGAGFSYPTIPAPTEANLGAAYAKTERVKPTAIYAGGDLSYFLVERQDLKSAAADEYTDSGDRKVYQDLLAAGNGMYGGIGNGQWNSTGVAQRVKTISGLQEYSEAKQTVQPIPIHSLSVASTHAAVVLSNAVQDAVSKQSFGNDVFVFGHNDNYQLGTGKRANLNIPQHLPPLPYPVSDEVKAKIAQKEKSGDIIQEEGLQSGTKSHMPHNRLQLASRKDKLEERIVCGYGTTAVYWHVEN